MLLMNNTHNSNQAKYTLAQTPKNTTIAMIGLGAMGGAVFSHLLGAGFTIHVFARSAAIREKFMAFGAIAFDTPAKAAYGADIIITNVTNTEDVQDVLLGENGAIHTAKSGALCIDHSTIDAQASQDIALVLAAKGIRFVDAPVSGGEKGAIAGTLAVMAGGAVADIAVLKTIAAHYSKSVLHIGDVGAGQIAKACNQMVMVNNIQGIAEAMYFADCFANNSTNNFENLASSFKLDTAKVLEALQAGMAGSKMLDLMGPKMQSGNYVAGIESRLHHKDFGIALAAAKAQGLHLPVSTAVAQQLARLQTMKLAANNAGLNDAAENDATLLGAQADTSALLVVLKNQELVKKQELAKNQKENETESEAYAIIADAAKAAESLGEIPVGAALFLDGQLVATGHNRTITEHDASAHAEIVALREAGKILGNYRLPETTLYVSLEPCAMCLAALFHARVGRVVYGATDPKTGACGGNIDLRTLSINHHTTVAQGDAAWGDECSLALQTFFKEKRATKKT